MSRRQYQCMDNSSGVGVLDKAAPSWERSKQARCTLAGLVQRDRSRAADGTPTRRRARAPPPRRPRPAGPVRPRPAARRAGRGRRRGPAPAPPPGPCSWPCATSPARAPSSTAGRATSGSAWRLPNGSSGLRDSVPGRRRAVDVRRLRCPDPAGLGGARAAAPRPARTRGSPRRSWPPSGVAAGRRASANASPASPPCPHPVRGPGGPGRRRGLGVSGPIERLPVPRAASTPPPCWPGPRSSPKP